jgi:hypothetical protein
MKTNTYFPESLFIAKNQGVYKYCIEQGAKICSTKTILFCGIARNVGEKLQRNIDCLHKTGELFKDYRIFIYENDSTDNTAQILMDNRSSRLMYLSEKRLDEDYRSKIDSGEDMWHYNRCVVLAKCRNKYLQYLESSDMKFDYLCVLDLDLKGGWSYDGIEHAIFTLENDPKTACVSAYGVLAEKHGKDSLEQHNYKDYVMYDSFAFRPLNWNIGIHLISTPMFNGINVERGDEPFEVDSNFGGMAIYKMQSLQNKKYGAKKWMDMDGFIDPDHVVLNRQIKEEGWKIIMDPSMIVSYSDHKYSKGQ